jgi:hypothetical protein
VKPDVAKKDKNVEPSKQKKATQEPAKDKTKDAKKDLEKKK